MTLRSIVHDLRESFGNLFGATNSSIPGLSGHYIGKSSDELQNSLVVIEQSSWASLPPELLRDVLKRLKQDDSNWPPCKDVVACASVCTTWRDMCKNIVRNPELCGKLMFPVSLKQLRSTVLQPVTYKPILKLSGAMLDDNGKFLLSAKKSRRTIYTDYAISMDSKNISRSSSGYIGRLRSNLSRTKFNIYDTQPPYKAQTFSSQERNSQRFSSRKVSPKVRTGSYPIAQVNYVKNALGTRGPRQMQCTVHSIPTSAVHPDDIISAHHQDSDAWDKEMPLVLVNKAPRWHTELQLWCLNFHGRVTVASVKNFQLIAAPAPPATGAAASEPPSQPRPHSPCSSSNHETVLLQFGRVSKDTFTMDYRYPLSAFQAFAICLTSFDTKVGVGEKNKSSH